MLMVKVSEEEFADTFLASEGPRKLVRGEAFVMRQLRTAFGIPDAVIIQHSDLLELTKFSLQYDTTLLKNQNAELISLLSKRTYITVDILGAKSGMPLKVINSKLKRLAEAQIVEISSNRVRISRSFTLPRVNVVGLEFKLDNWQKAFWQASRNNATFTQSYVIMPERKKEILEKNKQVFNSHNVSCAVYVDDALPVKYVSKSQSKMRANKYYMDTLARIVESAEFTARA